jgi:hypothetical protein
MVKEYTEQYYVPTLRETLALEESQTVGIYK